MTRLAPPVRRTAAALLALTVAAGASAQQMPLWTPAPPAVGLNRGADGSGTDGLPAPVASPPPFDPYAGGGALNDPFSPPPEPWSPPPSTSFQPLPVPPALTGPADASLIWQPGAGGGPTPAFAAPTAAPTADPYGDAHRDPYADAAFGSEPDFYEPPPSIVEFLPPPVTPLPPAYDPGNLYPLPQPVADAFAAGPAGRVRLDTPASAALLDFQNRQTDKQLITLGRLPALGANGPTIVPGAQLRLSALYGRTNTRGKFGYLGRFPPDFSGNTATDLRILQANLAATAYFTPWAAGYVETLFSDVFTFPTFNQGSFQVRQAYAVVGDVTRTPFYGFIGKKNVSFGDLSTLSPFTQALPWHYFAALGEGAGVGYARGGFHAVLTGLSGGRGIRTVDSPSDGRVNNFAFNSSYARAFGTRFGDVNVLVGAGYLHGTIYNADVPEHVDTDLFGPLNGAWDVNATLRWRRLILAAEYVKTATDWPVTGEPVTASKLEAAYDLSLLQRPLRMSASWGEGRQGPAGSEFEYNRQLVLGAGWQPRPNALLSAEIVRSSGFAPLIGLTAPGVSDRDVHQTSLVLGLSLAL